VSTTTGREPEAQRGALVIGYGNTLRSDDGAGPFVARALELRGPEGLRIVEAHQLTPEMAIAISAAKRVVFVDATDLPQESAPRVSRLEPEPGADPLNPHASDPGSLLWLAKTLFGGAPEAWLVAIPGAEFGFGETLSPGAARASAEAVIQIEALLART